MSSDRSHGDVVIDARGVSKSFRVAGLADRPTTFGEAIVRRLRHPLADVVGRHRYQALDEVTFQVHRGEVFGLIGANGAGKSTLLKVITRITHLDAGRIDIAGRVGSLLEVGTGFHPELTGRENIFLNGAVLGMTRAEIRANFDRIVEFAEVGEFIDTPVKRFSSGMSVRLAFSVAVHLDAEILLVDEVLAVGDGVFQRRCIEKIEEVATKEGRTVIFVSHNMAPIRRMCDRALVLERGRVTFTGPAVAAVEHHLGVLEGDEDAGGRWDLSARPGASGLDRLELSGIDGYPTTTVEADGRIEVVVDVTGLGAVSRPAVGIRINAQGDLPVMTWVSPSHLLTSTDDRQSLTLRVDRLPLTPAHYTIDLWIISMDRWVLADIVLRAGAFDVESPEGSAGAWIVAHGDGAVHVPAVWDRSQVTA